MGPQVYRELVSGTVEGSMEEKNRRNASIFNNWKCKIGEIIEMFGGSYLRESSALYYMGAIPNDCTVSCRLVSQDKTGPFLC